VELLIDGLREALRLISAWDAMVMSAALRSLWISTCAVALATAVGVPLGTFLGRTVFPGKWIAVVLCRAGMAIPTVFVGILCYAIFSRRGPLGAIDLLYSPWAIVVGELLLAVPIITSITHGAIAALDPRIGETALTLGAGLPRRWKTYVSEARVGVTLGILTAFARCVTELGIAMIVGGNIQGRTRTLATATALETGKGEFARGLAMGFILLAIALGTTVVIVTLSRERQGEDPS